MDLCIGRRIGAVATDDPRAFGGAVCHPIPGDVFVPRASRRCGIAPFHRAIGRLVCAVVLCVRNRRVAEASATGTWKEPSAAPHHDSRSGAAVTPP